MEDAKDIPVLLPLWCCSWRPQSPAKKQHAQSLSNCIKVVHLGKRLPPPLTSSCNRSGNSKDKPFTSHSAFTSFMIESSRRANSCGVSFHWQGTVALDVLMRSLIQEIAVSCKRTSPISAGCARVPNFALEPANGVKCSL